MNLSDALSTFDDQLPDIRKACVENIIFINSQHQPAVPDTDDMLAHVNHLIVKDKTTNLIRTIKRIDSRKKHFRGKNITDEDIIRAKEYPVEELYDGQLFGRTRKYGLCPFHNERTPSFYIFPDNRFKCFGCQVGGTAIDYVMLRDGVDFIGAVKVLQ